MTREKAIEYFEKAREASNSCTELYDMAIAALREQERFREATKTSGWISFDERFPDDSLLEKAIIVCIKNRWNEQRIDTVHWHGNEQRLNAAWFWCDVTHWMPLPKPPKEEV